jgi:hypothetical protein
MPQRFSSRRPANVEEESSKRPLLPFIQICTVDRLTDVAKVKLKIQEKSRVCHNLIEILCRNDDVGLVEVVSSIKS